MSLYVIGDLHLSFGVDKPMDIFHGWEDYVQRLTDNWQRKIQPTDTVVIAGDVSWGMTMDEAIPDFRFLNGLNGQKILLKGNHDYWFSTKTKVEAALAAEGISTVQILFNNAYTVGDIAVCGTRGWMTEPNTTADQKILAREAGRLRLSLEAGKALGRQPIVFLHYPPIGVGFCAEQLIALMHEYGVTTCYYGHLHGRACQNAFCGVRDGIEYRLISSDYIQFDPELVR